MFNLIKYRFIFLAASLLVIVPGVIALLMWGLNVGIDFSGGSSVDLLPNKSIQTTADVKNILQPLNLKDVQVNFTQNPKIRADRVAWIRLTPQIDNTVLNTIKSNVQKQFPGEQLNFRQDNYAASNGKPAFSMVSISGFSKLPDSTKLSQATTGLKINDKTAVTADAPVIGNNNQTQAISLLTSNKFQSNTGDIEKVQQAFYNKGIYVQLIDSSTVGGSVADQTKLYSIFAVAASSLAILLYLWFSFRKVSRPWRYGACAIIAMLHDVLVVVGIFSILGHFFNIQIDALFITALLTVVGFSVHDTIVVFDRIRENMIRRTTETFEQVVNASLVQTLARSLNTSLTVLFTLLALTLFGSSTSIHTFTLTLLIGIASGTYSSIFNASMLLVIWEHGELGFGIFGGKRKEQVALAGRRESRELARSRG
ncbi:protein translocase subunit SecF [Ktedonobacter racemifer]|uniref:Protein-export membrane protein SecF n=1 Tax=Ktedonobacter racemifer DSM 44963 TaxID=485913 RepID=D6TLT8_KTERA|nr:protein translocase subunit SecF [Ktedonobacter racemifer]EFH86738.1 protein-export membrane protein SecF [Ktedonobacter racemifer DSM 44963]